MDLFQQQLTLHDQIVATSQERVSDAFKNQSYSRECIRLSHLAIAHSRQQIEKAFETVPSQ